MVARAWLVRTHYTSVFIEPGWAGLVEGLLADIGDVVSDSGATVELRQIKEKLGSLRFYYRLHDASAEQDAEIERLVESAYDASLRTCSVCGARGELERFDGLLKTVCKVHTLHPQGSGAR